MNRPYTARQYLEVVTALSRRSPTPLWCGRHHRFSGETDREFEDTCAFVEHSPLTYLHVFSYSDRREPGFHDGTKVHVETIHERTVRLRALGERKKESFRVG